MYVDMYIHAYIYIYAYSRCMQTKGFIDTKSSQINVNICIQGMSKQDTYKYMYINMYVDVYIYAYIYMHIAVACRPRALLTLRYLK